MDPRFTLTATVLDTADPPGLARFYSDLLGWPIGTDEPEWVTLRPPGGGAERGGVRADGRDDSCGSVHLMNAKTPRTPRREEGEKTE